MAETLHQAVTIDERVIEAGNDFEGMTVGSNPKQLLNPRLWPKLVNPTVPSWGEPYTQIASRMQAAVADARDAARGHEAVIVSHQLPVWIARLAFEDAATGTTRANGSVRWRRSPASASLTTTC